MRFSPVHPPPRIEEIRGALLAPAAG
jgi:hypothetical protein